MSAKYRFFACIFLVALSAYAFWSRSVLTAALSDSAMMTLVIDAGHGGEDGGAVSVSGKKESSINLEIAKRTEQLAALVGIRSRMVRCEDISVHNMMQGSIAQKKTADLKNRVKLVSETPGAVLLSIHQNHFAEAKYHGAQVFYAKTAGSLQYADSIQTDLKHVLDRKNRRAIKPAEGIFLMEHISCPAVLVECGFLSNSAEEQLLQQSDYQKKLALAMLRTFAIYGNRGINYEI